VSPDGNVIYASDFTTNKVIAININGQMTALYSHNLDKPYGVFLSPSGAIYICNRQHNVVYRMTSALSEVTIVIGPGDNLRLPQAIAFDRKTQHIYISRGCNDDKDANRIGVYQLK
jgi:DNA-binding beta-propeller fold protein YncE